MRRTILFILALIFLSPLSYGCLAEEPGIAKVSSGSCHSLLLMDDGTVRAWGSNNPGFFYPGTINNSNWLVAIDGLNNCTSVSAGSGYSLALKDDGTVWAWGNNYHGTLGDGSYDNHLTPARVKNLDDITDVSSRGSHCLALEDDGTVWAWGLNNNGQLGDGTQNAGKPLGKNIPVRVNISNVKAIATGGIFSAALKDDGTVWAWGSNKFGVLGYEENRSSTIPVQIPGLSNITKITGGLGHMLALKDDGTVWAWGDNDHCRLGNETASEFNGFTGVWTPVKVGGLSNIVDISAGNVHSMALDSDGTVYCWGQNSDGQIGEGSEVSYEHYVPITVNGLKDIRNISCGGRNSMAIDSRGQLWAWGANIKGECEILPVSNANMITAPVLILNNLEYNNKTPIISPTMDETKTDLQNNWFSNSILIKVLGIIGFIMIAIIIIYVKLRR